MVKQDDKQVRLRVSRGLALLLILATALLLRAHKGQRAFPSIDDYAYIPMCYKWLTPELYPADDLLQSQKFHMPVWALLVAVFEHTVGLANGFWACTFLLSILTVAALWSLLRALGGSALLLPLAALLGFASQVKGLGRGLYDSAFGDAFHMQWVALCLLLWCYSFVVRRRPMVAGIVLGLSTACHPVVGLHGAFVVALALLACRPFSLRPLLQAAISCALVSAPITVPIALSLWQPSQPIEWSASELIEKGFLFRTGHEFSLANVTPSSKAALLLLALLALAGWRLMAQLRPRSANDALGGLLLGHGALVVMTILFHGDWSSGGWHRESLWPFLLHLSRTTPLFVVLAAATCTAALEVALQEQSVRDVLTRLLVVVFLASFMFLLALLVRWDLWLGAAAGLALLAYYVHRRQRLTAAFGWLCGLAAAAGLFHATTHGSRQASVPSEYAQLYDWIKRNSGREALFIIPPGFQEFRLYTKRSVYVDFKLFPSPAPELIPEWRRRMELISEPDGLDTQQSLQGWAALPYWDRTYAQNNTPSRIAKLLEETGANFLVWDNSGLDVPPWRDVDRSPAEGLVNVFQNDRFEIYRLRDLP